jgi:DNA polymerase III delta prime subunit
MAENSDNVHRDLNGRRAPVDPTANVLALVEAAVRRLDDLRAAEVRRIDDLRAAEVRRIDDLMECRLECRNKLEEAEAKRLDAINTVNVRAVDSANERAAGQAALLAGQVTQTADTLRTLVKTTADAMAEQSMRQFGELTTRLAAVEKAQAAIMAAKGISNQVLFLIAGIAGGVVTFAVQKIF